MNCAANPGAARPLEVLHMSSGHALNKQSAEHFLITCRCSGSWCLTSQASRRRWWASPASRPTTAMKTQQNRRQCSCTSDCTVKCVRLHRVILLQCAGPLCATVLVDVRSGAGGCAMRPRCARDDTESTVLSPVSIDSEKSGHLSVAQRQPSRVGTKARMRHYHRRVRRKSATCIAYITACQRRRSCLASARSTLSSRLLSYFLLCLSTLNGRRRSWRVSWSALPFLRLRSWPPLSLS